jgi:hypothetical protein
MCGIEQGRIDRGHSGDHRAEHDERLAESGAWHDFDAAESAQGSPSRAAGVGQPFEPFRFSASDRRSDRRSSSCWLRYSEYFVEGAMFPIGANSVFAPHVLLRAETIVEGNVEKSRNSKKRGYEFMSKNTHLFRKKDYDVVVDAVIRNRSPLRKFPANREKNRDFCENLRFASVSPIK